MAGPAEAAAVAAHAGAAAAGRVEEQMVWLEAGLECPVCGWCFGTWQCECEMNELNVDYDEVYDRLNGVAEKCTLCATCSVIVPDGALFCERHRE